jgi:hypothetical protein
MNPPILPWVTDFTSQIILDHDINSESVMGGIPWRDLTKVNQFTYCMSLYPSALTQSSLVRSDQVSTTQR